MREHAGFEYIKVGLIWYYKNTRYDQYNSKYHRWFKETGTLPFAMMLDRKKNFSLRGFWIKLEETSLEYSKGGGLHNVMLDEHKIAKPFVYIAFHSSPTNYIMLLNEP